VTKHTFNPDMWGILLALKTSWKGVAFCTRSHIVMPNVLRETSLWWELLPVPPSPLSIIVKGPRILMGKIAPFTLQKDYN